MAWTSLYIKGDPKTIGIVKKLFAKDKNPKAGVLGAGVFDTVDKRRIVVYDKKDVKAITNLIQPYLFKAVKESSIKLRSLMEQKKVIKEAGPVSDAVWGDLDDKIGELLKIVDRMNGKFLNTAQYQRIRKRIFDLHEYISNI